jgi:3-hydroxyisobutyrate dehydrogenase
MKKVTFLGLGIMGSPMSRHIKKAGFDLTVWNRNAEKAEKFAEDFQANYTADLALAVTEADVVLMCLGNDKSVQDTVNIILPAMKKGAVLIDHTTTSAKLARHLYETCKTAGVNFLEAPVTGGQIGAEQGKLTMMCAGDEQVYQQVLPILDVYALKREYFGKSGNGQAAKMMNQICIAGILQSLAEAVNFAKKEGLDTDKLFQLLATGAGGSWQMANRYALMVSGDYQENFGFPVEWMLKDLGICIDEAEAVGANLEIIKVIRDKYQEINDTINPRFDSSSLVLLNA